MPRLDCNNLDLSDPFTWTLVFKSLVLVFTAFLVCLVWYGLDIAPKHNRLTRLLHEEAELRHTLVAKAEQHIELDTYQSHLRALRKRLHAIGVHSEQSYPSGLLEYILQAGQAAKLDFEHFEPQLEQVGEQFITRKISFVAHGDYQAVANFFAALSLAPQLLVTEKFQLEVDTDPSKLKLVAIIVDYRLRERGKNR